MIGDITNIPLEFYKATKREGEIMKLYIMIGNIGSGKTAWSKNFVKENANTKIVSGDGFRVMLNGTYEYVVGLDDIITASMVDTIKHLFEYSYNVIVDVCNITNERRKSWLDIPDCWKVAVVFPSKDKDWHIANRAKEAHCKDKDWERIYEGNCKAFEPIDGTRFDEIIKVEEW